MGLRSIFKCMFVFTFAMLLVSDGECGRLELNIELLSLPKRCGIAANILPENVYSDDSVCRYGLPFKDDKDFYIEEKIQFSRNGVSFADLYINIFPHIKDVEVELPNPKTLDYSESSISGVIAEYVAYVEKYGRIDGGFAIDNFQTVCLLVSERHLRYDFSRLLARDGEGGWGHDTLDVYHQDLALTYVYLDVLCKMNKFTEESSALSVMYSDDNFHFAYNIIKYYARYKRDALLRALRMSSSGRTITFESVEQLLVDAEHVDNDDLFFINQWRSILETQNLQLKLARLIKFRDNLCQKLKIRHRVRGGASVCDGDQMIAHIKKYCIDTLKIPADGIDTAIAETNTRISELGSRAE